MTLLIKNVRVLGARTPLPEPVDVFVSGDTISAIGSFAYKIASRAIDGRGAYLAPGFIDIQTESDHHLDLLRHPAQEDFLKQGITTIVGGHHGVSLAPLLYGELDTTDPWVNPQKTNVHWRTLKEFFGVLTKKKLGVNFTTLTGYETIRHALQGNASRAMTKRELGVFVKLFTRALCEGSLGISADLASVAGNGISSRDTKILAAVAAKHHGVYATTLPRGGFDGGGRALEEIIKLAEETKVKTLITDFAPRKGKESEYAAMLRTLADVPSRQDFYVAVPVSASRGVPLSAFLPEWAQKENNETICRNIADAWFVPRILKDMLAPDPHDFIILKAARHATLEGKSLADLMRFYAIRDPKRALIKLMLTTKLRAYILCKDIDWRAARAALYHHRSIPVSGGTSPRHLILKNEPKAPFPYFLSLMRRERAMGLEAAVKKITALPARLFGLEGRGVIAEGNSADLTLFSFTDTGEIQIRCVIVNGAIAVKDGEFQHLLAGKALKHSL